MSHLEPKTINPLLTELLDDPVEKVLMKRDGETRDDIVKLIKGMQTQWNCTTESEKYIKQ